VAQAGVASVSPGGNPTSREFFSSPGVSVELVLTGPGGDDDGPLISFPASAAPTTATAHYDHVADGDPGSAGLALDATVYALPGFLVRSQFHQAGLTLRIILESATRVSVSERLITSSGSGPFFFVENEFSDPSLFDEPIVRVSVTVENPGDGVPRSFFYSRLQMVPEPGTLVLLASGVAATAAYGRSRGRRPERG
jgi:hypothetical protein